MLPRAARLRSVPLALGAALAAGCGGSAAGTGAGTGAGAPSATGGPAASLPAAPPTAAAPTAVAPAPTADTTRPAAMRPLPKSAHLLTAETSQAGEAGVRVLRDAAAWQAAWQQLTAGQAPSPPPAVDFAREMVVLVAEGEKSSGGHAIHVDGTSEEGGTLVLHATRTAPGPGCMATRVMTSPVDVVRVPRSAGAVRLQVREVATPC